MLLGDLAIIFVLCGYVFAGFRVGLFVGVRFLSFSIYCVGWPVNAFTRCEEMSHIWLDGRDLFWLFRWPSQVLGNALEFLLSVQFRLALNRSPIFLKYCDI